MPTENKPAESLQIERSTETKLVNTGVPRLYSIAMFLEDFGRHAVPIDTNPNEFGNKIIYLA